MTKPRVAILGLGLMGGGMAGRLIGEGFTVAVYNRTPEKAQAFGRQGARVCATPRDAAAGAEVIISMLADDAASRGAWLGESGALAGAAAGTLLVESSTLSTAWVAELAAAAAARGCELIDAPVTGSKPQAAAGQLLFLAGGSDAAIERARPVLSVLGRDVVRLGPVGSGALVKLINNFVCGVQLVALAEAVALIERTDLDAARTLAVLTEGAPGSPLVKVLSQRMTARDYTPNFRLKLMAKDLKYAIDEAGAHSVALATARAALETVRSAAEAGHAEQDLSSVVELLRSSQQRPVA
ncbi:MAG TPA: NAD(P)-dependent oxidoreductase [Tepidisphaeraceae bacterium]|nr:NAD(P)-dependent oxidoreductase [Tepidisphaeraceae bacterium]